MPSKSARAALLLAAFAAMAGCDSPTTGSAPPVGVYVLKSVAGVALPAAVDQPGTQPRTVVADTLVLRADSTGSEHFVGRTGGPGTANDAEWMQEMSWRRVDGEVQITFICPPNADCIAGPHLKATEASDTGLVVTYSTSTRTPLQYRRIAP